MIRVTWYSYQNNFTFLGVPIQKHVAGTACGLVTRTDSNDAENPDIEEYQILTDILVCMFWEPCGMLILLMHNKTLG
jgi:hypothetical protein